MPLNAIEQKLLEGRVIQAMQTIYDPEIPVNIYELGLIYEIQVDETRAAVKMTLTAPACPVAGTLPGEVETKIEGDPRGPHRRRRTRLGTAVGPQPDVRGRDADAPGCIEENA